MKDGTGNREHPLNSLSHEYTYFARKEAKSRTVYEPINLTRDFDENNRSIIYKNNFFAKQNKTKNNRRSNLTLSVDLIFLVV